MTENRKRKQKLTKAKISNKVLQLFREEPKLQANYKQIAGRLRITNKAEQKIIIDVLEELAHQEFIDEIQRGKYRLTQDSTCLECKIDMSTQGYAYCYGDDLEQPIFISQKNLHYALDEDIVKIYLLPLRKGRSLEGEVLEIIERSHKKIVGTISLSHSFAFLVPDNKKIPFDIFIPKDSWPEGIANNQKATVVIKKWNENLKNPIGEIVDILGFAGENETEMHAILEEFELPYHFPKAIDAEANAIEPHIDKEEIMRRRDMREVLTFTIDPFDAKDFDDAISYVALPNGNFEIGVHIADVSHYVKPNTALDKEAYARGTSVYLVDRVVPMLPERLSNFICSLRPDEEKLTFSVVFEFNKKAEIVGKWLGKTVIKSNRRYAYEEVQTILEGADGDYATELRQVNEITKQLRKKRYDNGALSFDRSEVKFKIDENGKPTGVEFKESKEANQLIEELMLLANKTVAEQFSAYLKNKRNLGAVYRVHDNPNSEKLKQFAQFIKQFDYKINMKSRKTITSSMNALLEAVKGKDIEDIIVTLSIRSMAKAIYSTQNIGHYGLAFKDYTHFTSPIRRYPDLLVHRELFALLSKGKLFDRKEDLEKSCKYLSQCEHRAVSAERMSIKYKQVEFMSEHIGEEFDGIISGVSQWGLFIELIDTKSEGLVPVRSLNDDFYVLDESNYRLVGTRYKRTYQLGGRVKVRITKANILKKQLDLEIISDENDDRQPIRKKISKSKYRKHRKRS
jgi:ribonuclease R